MKSIVVDGIANHAIARRMEELADGAALIDLFDDDLAIVVLGKENLERAGVSVQDAKLLLQGHGYFLDDLAEEYHWARVRPMLPPGACNIARISTDLIDHVGLFSELICLASRQSSAAASLLVYYQIIEIVADKLLGARLHRLLEDPPQGSWELREALRRAASEKSRLVAMCDQAARRGAAQDFGRLRDLGAGILELCDMPVNYEDPAGAVLYAVRNLVVHNQGVMGADAHRALGEFVVSLHRAVFHIMRYFNAESVC